jgi:hypothetical protein
VVQLKTGEPVQRSHLTEITANITNAAAGRMNADPKYFIDAP